MATLIKGAKTQVIHNLPSDAELKRMFDQVPILQRFKVADQVIRAGMRPIATEAKNLIPVGKEKDRERRSEKQKREADWETHLKTTIRTAFRKGDYRNRGGGIGVVGPIFLGDRGASSKAFLISEWDKSTRQRWFWKKRPSAKSGYSWTARKYRNFMVDAANNTRMRQIVVMKNKLRKILHNIWKSVI